LRPLPAGGGQQKSSLDRNKDSERRVSGPPLDHPGRSPSGGRTNDRSRGRCGASRVAVVVQGCGSSSPTSELSIALGRRYCELGILEASVPPAIASRRWKAASWLLFSFS